MRLLAFDTSTDQMFIAVQHDAALWQWQGAGGPQSSTLLIPKIQEGLAAVGLAMSALDAIVFGQGPGSFTGLRTACSDAQGLALGADVPVLPVDSLLAVAHSAHQAHGCTQVLAVLDARMGEVYHAPYHWDGVHWQRTAALGLSAPAAVQLPPGYTLAGNAQAVYADLLPQAAQVAALPTALALLQLAPALLAAGQAVAPEEAMPTYIRDKVAQTTAERAALAAARSAAAAAAPQP